MQFFCVFLQHLCIAFCIADHPLRTPGDFALHAEGQKIEEKLQPLLISEAAARPGA